jgi:hypothetical protein
LTVRLSHCKHHFDWQVTRQLEEELLVQPFVAPVTGNLAELRYWQFCDQQGAVLCSIDLQEFWGDVGACIGIEREKLQGVLREGVLLGWQLRLLNTFHSLVAPGFRIYQNWIVKRPIGRIPPQSQL